VPVYCQYKYFTILFQAGTDRVRTHIDFKLMKNSNDRALMFN